MPPSVEITAEATPAGAANGVEQTIIDRYQRALRVWELWRPLWADAYAYTMPYRHGFSGWMEGENRGAEVYDETAVVAHAELASKVGNLLIPDFQRWVDLKAGRSVPADARGEVDQRLALVNEAMFEAINNSNFYEQAQEAIPDMLVSTGILRIDDAGPDIIRALSIPISDIVLDRGPFGAIDAFFFCRKVRGDAIEAEYPKATIPRALAEKIKAEPLCQVDFLEATIRDWSTPGAEVWKHRAIWLGEKVTIYEWVESGPGSCPYIPFRWRATAGETYGRGPALSALAAIKTLNLTVQLILENAEMAVSGIWQSDNPDILNTDTVRLLAGTIVPKMMGSTGLEPLRPGTDFSVADLILSDMRANVRKAYYADQFAPVDQTPMSATEVSLRQADQMERIGGPASRLFSELVVRTVQRVLWIMQKQGRIEIPRVDGRMVRVVPVSPLARQQRAQDAFAITSTAQDLAAFFGPQMMPFIMKPVETARRLAELRGVPADLVPTEAERQQLVQALQQAAQQLPQGAMP
jgi:hypothetical protein